MEKSDMTILILNILILAFIATSSSADNATATTRTTTSTFPSADNATATNSATTSTFPSADNATATTRTTTSTFPSDALLFGSVAAAVVFSCLVLSFLYIFKRSRCFCFKEKISRGNFTGKTPTCYELRENPRCDSSYRGNSDQPQSETSALTDYCYVEIDENSGQPESETSALTDYGYARVCEVSGRLESESDYFYVDKSYLQSNIHAPTDSHYCYVDKKYIQRKTKNQRVKLDSDYDKLNQQGSRNRNNHHAYSHAQILSNDVRSSPIYDTTRKDNSWLNTDYSHIRYSDINSLDSDT